MPTGDWPQQQWKRPYNEEPLEYKTYGVGYQLTNDLQFGASTGCVSFRSFDDTYIPIDENEEDRMNVYEVVE